MSGLGAVGILQASSGLAGIGRLQHFITDIPKRNFPEFGVAGRRSGPAMRLLTSPSRTPRQLDLAVRTVAERIRGPDFYRGGWCPYCNIQLRAYQTILPQILELGARLAAISPQLPDRSLSTAETNELTFDVLSDLGNRVAQRFGLVYALPQELRDALQSSSKALPGINADESWELAVPATYVIAPDRSVALASIDVDYRRRLEPEAIVATLMSIRSM